MRLLRDLFLAPRFFVAVAVVVALFLLAYPFPLLFPIARGLLILLGLLIALDALLLFASGSSLGARRIAPERLSNGDDNQIRLELESTYALPLRIEIVDEVPHQFQRRDISFRLSLAPRGSGDLSYSLRPVERGEYSFGRINLYVAAPIGLLQRRFAIDRSATVPVYPSYVQMRRYEILALADQLSQAGVRRRRRVGQTMEFEQIREYVAGDDYRTINWRATARHARPMVNEYEDEKSQRVYCVIDKGRGMRMPFEGMTLLDYAINATLVLANIATLKGDRAGLVSFTDRITTAVPADRRRSQMKRIMEALYAEQTAWQESSYEALRRYLRGNLRHRSLILLFTNFESLISMERQLPHLRAIARDHLLVVIFFENTELRQRREMDASTVEEIYLKTIAEKFAFEKRRIVRELSRIGVQSILSTPHGLTVNVINKYLELKSRRAL